MKFSLENKKVLLIVPQFFGYEQEIRHELERRGALVDFLLDRPFSSAFAKAVTRFRKKWVMAAAERYYNKNTNLDKNYDYVFVVNGQTLSNEILCLWRENFKKAKFILYMWDSFANRKDVLNVLKLYDFSFTFDPSDSEKYGIIFRPLFFSKGFEASDVQSISWDISFIGTAHSDRYAIVKKVSEKLNKNLRSFFYLYLQARWVYWVYKVINRNYRNALISEFNFSPIKKNEVQNVFISSFAILDIEHPKQNGLTMRTLETLGSQKKLITTNRQIVFYEFYSEDNICLIDRLNPVVPESFFMTPYKEVPPEIYQKYRLEGWVDEIFENVEA